MGALLFCKQGETDRNRQGPPIPKYHVGTNLYGDKNGSSKAVRFDCVGLG